MESGMVAASARVKKKTGKSLNLGRSLSGGPGLRISNGDRIFNSLVVAEDWLVKNIALIEVELHVTNWVDRQHFVLGFDWHYLVRVGTNRLLLSDNCGFMHRRYVGSRFYTPLLWLWFLGPCRCETALCKKLNFLFKKVICDTLTVTVVFLTGPDRLTTLAIPHNLSKSWLFIGREICNQFLQVSNISWTNLACEADVGHC